VEAVVVLQQIQLQVTEVLVAELVDIDFQMEHQLVVIQLEHLVL
tara:strand:+ start:116 stop:247 length:132 start_codon:yes stop_codon:yes gene_type:complete